MTTRPEARAATPDQVDQQQRVIMATKSHTNALLMQFNQLQADMAAYNNLGLGDDSVLADGAFAGTGTSRADYRAAITSLQAIEDLLKAGHGTNLSKFAL